VTRQCEDHHRIARSVFSKSQDQRCCKVIEYPNVRFALRELPSDSYVTKGAGPTMQTAPFRSTSSNVCWQPYPLPVDPQGAAIETAMRLALNLAMAATRRRRAGISPDYLERSLSGGKDPNERTLAPPRASKLAWKVRLRRCCGSRAAQGTCCAVLGQA